MKKDIEQKMNEKEMIIEEGLAEIKAWIGYSLTRLRKAVEEDKEKIYHEVDFVIQGINYLRVCERITGREYTDVSDYSERRRELVKMFWENKRKQGVIKNEKEI